MKSDIKKCLACGSEAKYLGEIPLRTKGAQGATQFFFGQFAELSEELYPLDIYRCVNCGHLEIYDLDKSLSKK